MKRIHFLAVLCGLLCSSIAFGQSKIADFAGVWTLSADKSSFGTLPPVVAVQQLMITQANDKLTIVSVNGENKNTFINTLDNQPANVIIASGAKITSMIQPDGKTGLKRTMKASVPNEYDNLQYTREEKWELSADGKSLTITATVTPSGAGSPYSFTVVYVKK